MTRGGNKMSLESEAAPEKSETEKMIDEHTATVVVINKESTLSAPKNETAADDSQEYPFFLCGAETQTKTSDRISEMGHHSLKSAVKNTISKLYPENWESESLASKILFYVVKLPCTVIIKVSVPPADEESWDPVLAAVSPLFFLPFFFLHFKSMFF